jgi:hypothetical protein
MPKQYDQNSLLAALEAGQRDFIEVEFIGRISIDETNFEFKPDDSLSLAGSDLGENFYLAGMRGEQSQVMLTGASGGIVGFGRMRVFTLNANGISTDWFTVQNSRVHNINCANSVFTRGFSLRDTTGKTLVLDGVSSNQSLFDSDNFEDIVGQAVKLGKRTPTTLAETA